MFLWAHVVELILLCLLRGELHNIILSKVRGLITYRVLIIGALSTWPVHLLILSKLRQQDLLCEVMFANWTELWKLLFFDVLRGLGLHVGFIGHVHLLLGT